MPGMEMSEEELAKSQYDKGGAQRWIDNPDESMYVVQGCHIVICFISVFAACTYLQFVLIPMGMAYFITFLLAPIMDAMEDRPYQFGTKFYCKENFLHPARKRYQKTARGELLDTVMLGKVPHMLAVLICFVVVGVFFSTLIGVRTPQCDAQSQRCSLSLSLSSICSRHDSYLQLGARRPFPARSPIFRLSRMRSLKRAGSR